MHYCIYQIAIWYITYNMYGVTHIMKLKINTSMTMHNFENGLIMHQISYVRGLYQEITSLNNLRLYSYILLSPNWKKMDINVITL